MLKSELKSEKKISPKAVGVGLLVYLAGAALAVVIALLFGAAAAYNASQAGANPQQIIEASGRASTSPGIVAASLIIDALFTALGGYLAARIAKRSWLVHALPVGLLSLFAGILFVLLAPVQSPLLILPFVLLLPVPLALAGGYAAKLGWMPLKAEEEEEGDEEENVELKMQEVADQWMLKRLRRQQEAAQSISHLVQQRREQEHHEQQRTLEEQKRTALERAMQESKAEACEDMRKIVRQAFLSHPAATEQDFERLWPAIRDEMFRQYALELYDSRQPHVQEKIQNAG
ncbi:MAG TPA: hypothetical protein VGB73_03460 [Pyrinomonadaceae bacterium]|jgi:hypothetical protein